MDVKTFVSLKYQIYKLLNHIKFKIEYNKP